MVNAVRSPQKSLSSITTEFTHITYTYQHRSKALSRYEYVAKDVKFSACTFSQILYTRQGTPRSSKYTAYVYGRHIRCTWDRRLLVGIVSLFRNARDKSKTLENSRYPNTYFFQTTPGNGFSFRYDWTVEIISSFASPAFLSHFSVSSSFAFFFYLALCNPIFFLFRWIIVYMYCLEEMTFPASLWYLQHQREISWEWRMSSGNICYFGKVRSSFLE